MRITKAKGSFFQSYEEIEFDFNDLGPTLIEGQTKAGKSTVMDLPCWVMYGETSKELGADDVRSWFADGEPTVGEIDVELDDKVMHIYRKRAKSAKDNDLWFSINDGDKQRGKDATNTQWMIDQELGVDARLYMSSAYIHQFSKSDTFFVAAAKYRREIVESIQDLSEPVAQAAKCAEEKKRIKADVASLDLEISKLVGSVDSYVYQADNAAAQIVRWEETRKARAAEVQRKIDSFETDREAKLDKLVGQLEILDQEIVDDSDLKAQAISINKQISQCDAVKKELWSLNSMLIKLDSHIAVSKQQMTKLGNLTGTCPTCFGPADNAHSKTARAKIQEEIAKLEAEATPLRKQIAIKSEVDGQLLSLEKSRASIQQKIGENQRKIDSFESLKAQAIVMRDAVNTYADQVETILGEQNPYVNQEQDARKKAEEQQAKVADREWQKAYLQRRLATVEWLYDASFKVKAEMLHDSVQRLQDRTNEILEEYFEGFLKVKFEIQDGDKVEIELENNGYDCKFKQLSGGERCMLKLAFNVAYMEAAQDCAGVHIDTVMMDEALHGLDPGLKVGAYNLIEHLAERHSTVMVIEHSEEFKTSFPRVYSVTNAGARSNIVESST